MNIQNRIIELKKQINQHNINYYVYDNPIITDATYDLLLKELEQLEKAKSTLKEISSEEVDNPIPYILSCR